MLGKPKQVGGLLGWLLACFAAAAIGGASSLDAGPFYLSLQRPDWAPPAGWFGPVWTVLFAAMGLAAWLVWRTRGFAGASRALALFVLQLAVNASWSWLFFGWHLGAAALACMVLLIALVFATALAFRPRHPWAALLLVPYLLWLAFALALNMALWRMNPTQL